MSGRVATVLRKYDPAEWGGAETHIVEIARRLGAEGWQNEIYAPMGPTTPDTALPASVPLRRYWAHAPFLGSAAQRRALIANAGNIISFDLPLRLAFDRSIDVAHVHTGGRIAGAVRVAMRRTGRPYVMSFHGPVFGGASFQAVDQARRNRGVLDIGQPYGVAVGARRVIDDAARVIVFNGEEHAGLSARIGSRAVQMDHGVDLARIERGDAARARRRFPALGEGPFALLIGRLALQKNQLLAIQAFAAAAPEGWSLVLAGAETDPGYRAQVEAAIRSAGLEGRVHVLGNVDGQVEIPDLLAASSLLMTPSLHEAFGLVVLEASTRAAGMGDCATWTTGLTCATAMPIAPLWFLVVLVPLTALTPWLARHWHGRWRIGLPLAVVAVTVVSDALWIGGGSALPLNEVTVWALVWFAGFAYADGTFDRVGVRTWWAVVAGGTAVMVALVVVGPYPPWLGASPRTMMTVLECVVGVSLLLALRGPITAVRDRRAVDWTVRNVGDRIMGVFLWHYLAFAAVISAAGLAGVDLAEHLGWPYVAQRAVIIPVALVLLVGLLRVVAPVDRIPYPADRPRARRSDAVAEPLDGPGGRR